MGLLFVSQPVWAGDDTKPTALWGKAVQTERPCGGSDIQLAPDEGIYIIGNAGTRTEEEYVKLGNENLVPGTLYRGTNDNSDVQMVFFTKLNAEGQPQWSVYSKDGEAMSNSLYLQPTADGVVVFFGIRHAYNGADHSPVLVDATGKETSLEWTLETANATRYYIAVVMKVSNEGSIQWVRKITDDGIVPNAFTQDEAGNLYIGGRNASEMFLRKLDKDGNSQGQLLVEGKVSYMYLNTMLHYQGKLYVMGYILPAEDNHQVSIGGKSLTLPNEFATPFLVCLGTDLKADWVQVYEAKKKGFTMQTPGLYINNSHVWLVGTALMSLTTKSGKALDNGDLTRAGVVMKFDASNGDLLDGFMRMTDQTGYFAAFEDENGNIYAACHQGTQTKFAPSAGPLWIDKFNPTDLSAPVSSWENMIQNAAGTQGIAYTSTGRLYTMTRSKIVPNALMESSITIDQTSTHFSCNVCAFQLPVNPVITTAIRTIESESTQAVDTSYYTLSGLRVSHPTKGIYIHNGKKVVVK